ncbi:hypothetical protein B0H11DRAFT_1912651 [Mycena galericulata]|nr:hypothetical protein B0H11DRAFT_1912651 [Mycena galericulata]
MTTPTLTPSMDSVTPSPPTPAEIEKLIQLTQDAQTTSYFAALGMQPFEASLYPPLSIRAVCHTVQSAESNTHHAILIVVREIETDKYHQFEGASSTLIVLTIDIILLFRVWILFAKSRRLMYFLVPLMCVEIGVMFLISVFAIMGADTRPKFFTLYLIPSLIVSFIMFIMTMYNCKTRLDLSFSSRNTMPLVDLFLRDGIFWFLAVFTVNLPQVILWAVARPTLTLLLLMVYSIIGSRVLLNIMEVMINRVKKALPFFMQQMHLNPEFWTSILTDIIPGTHFYVSQLQTPIVAVTTGSRPLMGPCEPENSNLDRSGNSRF